MKKLEIASGLVDYEVNASLTLRFNPTDTFLAEKLYNTYKELEEKQKDYEAKTKDLSDDIVKTFEMCRDMDRDMRESVNKIFDNDICTPLIGDANINMLADGAPVWANILLALMDEMDESAFREAKISKERIEKYTKKYGNKKNDSRYIK